MEQSDQQQLLTTRLRTTLAVGFTAYSLALAIRDVLHLNHARAAPLLPFGFWFHGWPVIALNVAFYGYLCWLAFWFIRGTRGRERTFMIGWAVAVLLPPMERLHPQWAAAIRHTAAISLTFSLFAALWLFMHSDKTNEIEP